ncbi:MAG: hypothetical protein U9N54_02065 [candidate division Zixibacteria bacterium]|nr:hypothetical protein [candidate division Zixibacteria bacterium]
MFETKEHSQIKCEEIDISTLPLDFDSETKNVNYLNLSSSFHADYFIGVDWLVEEEYALAVYPKIDELDYVQMFIDCLSEPIIAKEINKNRGKQKIYDIYFDKSKIKIPANRFEITPILIIHFLSVVKKIVKKGLKKGYVRVQENLSSKVKGRILLSNTIKNNHVRNKHHKTFCSYQKFTSNCIENRILKKALVFVSTYLTTVNLRKHNQISQLLNFCMSAFENISDDVDIRKIKTLKSTNFFKEYEEGLKLAKMIMERFSYALDNATRNNETVSVPFYINMPLLFELYVFSKLKKAFRKNILYQFHGKYGETDFLDIENKTIIDAKYKEKYQLKYDIEDIRQLSGYSRDCKVLKKLNIDTVNPEIVDCLIIYPNQYDGKSEIITDIIKDERIEGFVKFYKYGIKLPQKN